MWARYDFETGEKEELISHLSNVGKVAQNISLCLKNKNVLNRDLSLAAFFAGIFHDCFKVAYQPINIYEYSLRHSKLIFPYHEVISSIFLANYIVREFDLNLDNENAKRVVKAVLLHHQGLRIITLEEFWKGYNYVLNVIEKRGVEYVLSKINEILKYFNLPTIDMLEKFIEFRTLEDFIRGGDEYDRFLTGILMVADNYVVSRCLNKSGDKLLLEEVNDYINTICNGLF